MKRWNAIVGLCLIVFMFSCSELGPGWDTGNQPKGIFDPEKADSGVEAVFLDFSFDGELVTDWAWRPESTIETQLMFTVGQLNAENSVGRLDRVALSNIQTTQENGQVRITYHAVLVVAWNNRNTERSNYTFVLPYDLSSSGKSDFFGKYKSTCSSDSHDAALGTFWYYYRPNYSQCSLEDEDIVRLQATLSPSDISTTGKYPEYHKIWEDDVLRVVAVFGKNEEGATDNWDAGISTYNEFTRKMKSMLESHNLQTTPEEVPSSPGVDVPEVEFRATLSDGGQVVVNAILIDSVRSAGYEFDRRYAELSPRADFIAYNGHSGYGSNIRALATKGSWVPGQFVLVLMNGCDTYAYVDSAINDAHSRINPDDPIGTKYVDMIMNAMPAYFSDNAFTTAHITRSLMNREAPKTYEQIFENVASNQVIAVSGEEDNVYRPGGPGPDDWEGVERDGQLSSGETFNYQTPTLKAGSYVFEMTGSGDADLYVRVGQAPTRQNYDCRPYKATSDETCRIELSSDSVIYVMVSGYSSQSEFHLVGRQEGTNPDPWEGMRESGELSASETLNYQTPALDPGNYRFEITGTGDADLYVRVSEAPSRQDYDCRPYKSDSNEVCRVTLVSRQVVHLMVSGYSDHSTFELVGMSE